MAQRDQIMTKRAGAATARQDTKTKAESWNDEERTAEFVMSSEVEDRDGDIIRVAGIDLDAFKSNPVALYMHDRGAWKEQAVFPIGHWENVRVEGKNLVGTLRLRSEGSSAVVDEVASCIAEGALRACSIGFSIREAKQRYDANENPLRGLEITRSELRECSVVIIPANQGAIIKSKSEQVEDVSPSAIADVLRTYEMRDGVIVKREDAPEAEPKSGGEDGQDQDGPGQDRPSGKSVSDMLEEAAEADPSLLDRIKDVLGIGQKSRMQERARVNGECEDLLDEIQFITAGVKDD